MSWRNRIILIAILLVVPIALIALTVMRRLSADGEDAVQRGIPVRVQQPYRGRLVRSIRYSGHLVPNRSVTVLSKISGKIGSVLVEKGDDIQYEQELVLIEDESLMLVLDQAYYAWQAAEAQYAKASKGLREQEIETARAIADKAEKDYQLAKDNYDRASRLYEKGTISRAGFEESEAALRAAQTGLENARRSLALMEEGASQEELAIARENARAMKAQYELARLQADYAVIRSPADGIVADILVDEGNMVSPTVPILVIVQDDPILARIAVPERYYRELSNLLQQQEEAWANIYPVSFSDGQSFSGRIRRLDPMIDPLSRTFDVEIQVANPSALLRPGMYVNAEIDLEIRESALLIPVSALLERDGREVVFLASSRAAGGSSGTAMIREVVSGLSNTDSVQILSGLTEGDWVVVEGNAYLEDGQEVETLSDQ
jgi:RND family efflux transporter MFP subunit